MAFIRDKDEFIVTNKDDLAKVIQRMIDVRDENDLAKPAILSEREKKELHQKKDILTQQTTVTMNALEYEQYRLRNLHLDGAK